MTSLWYFPTPLWLSIDQFRSPLSLTICLYAQWLWHNLDDFAHFLPHYKLHTQFGHFLISLFLEERMLNWYHYSDVASLVARDKLAYQLDYSRKIWLCVTGKLHCKHVVGLTFESLMMKHCTLPTVMCAYTGQIIYHYSKSYLPPTYRTYMCNFDRCSLNLHSP